MKVKRLPLGDTSYIRKDFSDFLDLKDFLYFLGECHGFDSWQDIHSFEGKALIEGVTGFVLDSHYYSMNFTIFDLYLLAVDDICEQDAGYGGNRVLIYQKYLKEFKEKDYV